MGRYTLQPTLAVEFLRPSSFSFDVPGSGLDGGRNGLGESITLELTGGGIVTGAYEQCFVHEREQFEYVNHLGARLNGGHRFINVPIKTDWSGPFPTFDGIPKPVITGIRHSDGSLFSDGAGYAQGTVLGVLASDAGLNAGRITVDVVGNARRLRWSEWMSICHPTKGWRAFRSWESSEPEDVSVTIDGTAYAGERYTLAISPPLREAAPAGTLVEFATPTCVMKFPQGFTLPYRARGFWRDDPTVQFTEAF